MENKEQGTATRDQGGKFWAIGVGPGDPELVALKAVRLIRSADVLYHAGPNHAEGFALDIVRSMLRPEQPVRAIQVPMRHGPDDWRQRYRPAVERIAADCREGNQVVFITEGDPTLYSTAGYLWELLRESCPDVASEVVPGVTSITAGAARAGLPLARKHETLAVVPAGYQARPFDAVLDDFDAVAFVKLAGLNQPGDAWPRLLDDIPESRELVYLEKLGTPTEWLTRDRARMRERRPPYFSLLLATRPSAAARAQEAPGKLWVVGLGPGAPRHLTLAARDALRQADAIVGYSGYLEMLRPLGLSAELFAHAIGEEEARADQAVQLARAGRRVCVVSSGDAGVYGMAGLVLERAGTDLDVEIVPGITAAVSAAALLGAPLGHDFACLSLSDLLTPWDVIERRLEAAAAGDFVIALYNPASQRRNWQLARTREILLRHRSPDTPVGIVDNAYRNDQRLALARLGDLPVNAAAMTTILVIGSSRTRLVSGRMITPRGYAGAE